MGQSISLLLILTVIMNRSRINSEHSQSQSRVKVQRAVGESPQTRIYNRYHVKRSQQQSFLQHQYLHQINLLANTPKITPSSYNYLVSNIQKQLTSRLNSLSNSPTIRVQEINDLILSFISKKQLNIQDTDQIKILSGQLYLILCKYNLESEPNLHHIFGLFRLLLDPFNHTGTQMTTLLTKNPDFSDIEQQREQFIRQNPSYKQKTMKVEQILLLFKKIRIKHEMFQKKQVLKHRKEEYSFRPTLNQKSQELASKSLTKYLKDNHKNVRIQNSSSKHQLLYNRKLEKDTARLKKVEKDPECTFQPNSTSHTISNRSFTSEDIVDRLYHVPKKSNRNLDLEDQEEELKKCTFEPSLISKSPTRKSLSRNVSVRNYEKSVKRMATARSKKEELKEAYDNLGKVRNKNSKAQPPSMALKQPKIILEIKIDEFRVQKLKIFGNQNPRIQAKKFVLKHGLKDQMIEVLIDILNQYCSEYISCESSQLAF